MKPVVKKSELDSFEKWKEDEAKKYVKKYKKKLEHIFGDRAFLIKTGEDFRSLQNQISYFSSIRNEEVVKEN